MPAPLDAINGLSKLEQGTLVQKLWEAICEVSDATIVSQSTNPNVKIHKGKVIFELEILHDIEWDPNMVVHRGTLKKTLPKHEPRGATFFVYEGSLFRENPLEEPLPGFREVPKQDAGFRDPDQQTAAEAK